MSKKNSQKCQNEIRNFLILNTRRVMLQIKTIKRLNTLSDKMYSINVLNSVRVTKSEEQKKENWTAE